MICLRVQYLKGHSATEVIAKKRSSPQNKSNGLTSKIRGGFRGVFAGGLKVGDAKGDVRRVEDRRSEHSRGVCPPPEFCCCLLVHFPAF